MYLYRCCICEYIPNFPSGFSKMVDVPSGNGFHRQHTQISRVGYLPSIEQSPRTPGEVFDPIMIGQGFSYIHTAFSTCMYLWCWILHRVFSYRFLLGQANSAPKSRFGWLVMSRCLGKYIKSSYSLYSHGIILLESAYRVLTKSQRRHVFHSSNTALFFQSKEPPQRWP